MKFSLASYYCLMHHLYYCIVILTVFNVIGQKTEKNDLPDDKVKHWLDLEELDLSNTSLVSIESILPQDPGIVLKNLTSLRLDFNSITELNFDFILRRMPNVQRLSLRNNSIFNVTCDENSRFKVRSQFKSIGLGGNAINCDKSHLWFMKYIQNPPTNLTFPDSDLINCSYPKKLADMTWSQRISVQETKICDLCDCRSLKKAAISVDCHNRSLTSLPDVLPLNTKVLNLTSNQIDRIGKPSNPRNWENVTYVYLKYNRITTFQPWEFNSKFMKNLAALDIRSNKFQGFSSHLFEQFSNLDQVHLSDNPWLCDCEMVRFQEWLQRHFQKVGDKEEIKCGISGSSENGLSSNSLDQRLSGQVIYKLSKSELCPQDDLEESSRWLDIINGILIILILLIVLKVALDHNYQKRTRRLPHFFELNL